MRRSRSKLSYNSLIRTTKDYANQSSIHGIGYIFDQKLGVCDRLLWLMVVLAFLSLATYLTWNTWIQWREEQVVMSLKNQMSKYSSFISVTENKW